MKKYIKPAIKEVDIESSAILAGSGGLGDGDLTGNGYDPTAPSYSKRHGFEIEDDWDE